MSESIERMIAMFPSEDERDFEVHGTRVISLIRLNTEFMLTLSGGTGYCIQDGEFHDWETVTDIDVRFGWLPEDADTEEKQQNAVIAADGFANVLTHWQEQETTLLAVSGPGTPFYLIENSKMWLPIPRT